MTAQTAKCLQCRRPGFNLWVGKILGEGNGKPLQYSCLEKPMGRGALQAIVHRVTKSQTQLSVRAQVHMQALEKHFCPLTY